jgi:hypothetical protein
MHPAFYNTELAEKVKADSEEIKVVSYKDIPEVKRMIETTFIQNMYKAIPKECYKNAAEFASLTLGVEYVEGIVNCHGLPIAHAWNSFEGQYFDLTFEMNGRLDVEEQYLKLFSLDKTNLYLYMTELGYYGAFGLYHYTKKKFPYQIAGI